MATIKDETESCGSRPFVASSSQENPRQCRMKLDVYDDVLQRLQESNSEEASLPDFEEQLWQHFNRLPARYALDVQVERAEDILTHQRLLKSAEDSGFRPVFQVRSVQVSPRNSADDGPALEEDAQSFSHASGQGILAPPTFGSSTNFEAIFTHGNEIVEDVDSAVIATCSTRPMHEITFSSVDRPKLLRQLTGLLVELALNIQEAHAFSTVDGFSLDVFVVDGWSQEDSDGLKDALSNEIMKLKEPPKPRSLAFFGHGNSSNDMIQASIEIPTDGTDEWELDVKHLKVLNKVASGSYGDLHRGTYCGQEVAVKFLKPEGVNAGMLREFSQEVFIMKKIRHKNIVQFLGACTLKPTLCIVTEFMTRGSIYDFLHKQKYGFKVQTLLKAALDVANGMCYLHQHNIIHRDLKTANLLIDQYGLIKIADFGVARVQLESGIMTAETGTYRWMAPEVIEHKPYSHKADVYSYAIVLWELLTGQIPYQFMTPLQAAVGVVQRGVRPNIPKKTNPKLKALIVRCWDKDPSQRPDFEEITEILQQIIIEVGDEDHSKDNECLSFFKALRKTKPLY